MIVNRSDAGTAEHQILHDVFEFPDIARPVVLSHIAVLLIRQLEGTVILFTELCDEMSAQGLDIIDPLAKGRHIDRDYVQPVIEILPEFLVGNLLHQIAVGQCQEADIQLDRCRSADPGDLLGLDGTKQLGLKIQRHVADLIQHQGTVVGHFKQPLFPFGAGT